MSATSIRTNRLGDVRAEHDKTMLSHAFYETPDYLTLIEPSNRSKCLVVGRRGTGKSALCMALERHYSAAEKSYIIQIAPEDFEILRLRGIAQQFHKNGQRYNLIRSAFKIFWRYAIAMEIANKFKDHYKIEKNQEFTELASRVASWNRSGTDFFSKLFTTVSQSLKNTAIDDECVGNLASIFPVRELEKTVALCLKQIHSEAIVLIDKLDEGYEADIPGLSIIGGLAHAVTSVAGMIEHIAIVLFLRDNVFRAIAQNDTDFSRNLEGQVLRLHWERYHLFNMICARLRIAYNLTEESNLKVWDKCTAQDIRGSEGFDRCIRLTLYRPRDLMLLLNESLRRAESLDRLHIDNSDIESTAKSISQNRLDDLRKEYESIVVGLGELTSIFHGVSCNYIYNTLTQQIDQYCTSDRTSSELRQHYAIIQSDGIISQLYSIGFLGISDKTNNTFIFSHDGKNIDSSISPNDLLLVHPCYWIALGIKESALNPELCNSIHDEYDVEVSSETPEIRHRTIGRIMNELDSIALEAEGAAAFESWCKTALEILLIKSLRNFELHPNSIATQRRDIVATNISQNDPWSHIYSHYGTRQVIFEIKNIDRDLGPSEFRQIYSYLCGEYGRLAFIVTRGKSIDLRKGAELDWVKELYHNHKVVIIKISGPWLKSLLSKIRSPQKHDAASQAFSGLLDRYQRLYLNIRAK